LQSCENRSDPAGKPAWRAFAFMMGEQTRAHRRRGGERNEQGQGDRRGQHHGKLAEQAADDSAHETSRVPRRAASRAGMPASTWREMFSSTTTASSTTKPVAIVRAISDRLSML
jgi:hypothetical protein